MSLEKSRRTRREIAGWMHGVQRKIRPAQQMGMGVEDWGCEIGSALDVEKPGTKTTREHGKRHVDLVSRWKIGRKVEISTTG
ncbi:Hypothetical protein CINCED_3A019395 [Cinara cedri]|uniref:Uncharacterized protein n=1 Tax=Cinara cedri TaxID=506608 RepID=A0A5E4M3K0_9HEMI|nr:Hypothetical protein CINCED_3A019395 [Cinara cedri]